MCGADIFLAVLAVFFPPVAVWIKVGICTADSIINIALCCLGYIPGLLHAWYIILQNPDPEDYPGPYEPLGSSQRAELENGRRVTYYYVSRQPGPQQPPQSGYGTINSPPHPPHVPSAPRPDPRFPEPNLEAGSSDVPPNRPPPTYAEAVKGDYKIQSHD
ncbi:hypothetical protein VTN49DRAFT_4329 [Thermomyces lanuginosus]|uniref:uncharacterized protein n=1 Tax=Thermomyces lanuginosus TaxID=5541 RepID=UPI003743B29C